MSLLLLSLLSGATTKAEKVDHKARLEAARTIVAAVVEAGRANARLDKPKKVDGQPEGNPLAE